MEELAAGSRRQQQDHHLHLQHQQQQPAFTTAESAGASNRDVKPLTKGSTNAGGDTITFQWSEDVVENYRSAQIPLDVIWNYDDHMDARKDFTLSPMNYPRPKLLAFLDMLQFLEAQV
ncbi:alpha-glucosidase [Hordeum vulgare]|nr:alpha-glucosidase [Hordeum vulgare]